VLDSTNATSFRRLDHLRKQGLAQLDARLRQLREATAAPVEVDHEYTTADCSAAELGAVVVEITSRTVQDIEGALGRLARGQYGICGECRRRIAAARLRALPFAFRCSSCQRRAESEHVPLAG
jgi:DnaK suppressor protein